MNQVPKIRTVNHINKGIEGCTVNHINQGIEGCTVNHLKNMLMLVQFAI